MPDLTPNINLKKPLLTEAADIEVINENMDIIDSEIGKVRDSAKKEHLADLFTNGIIPNALNELRFTETDILSKAIKIDTGKVNLEGIVYTYNTQTIIDIAPSEALAVTNEPHTTDGSGALTLTYFPVSNQAGDELAAITDIVVTKVSDGSTVNVITINPETGEVTTDTSNESVQVNYKSFSKRIDVVYVDTDGTLKILKGTPVLPIFNPTIPIIEKGIFNLGEINLSSNFNVVTNDMIKSYDIFYSINGLEDELNEVGTQMADLVQKPISANDGEIALFDTNQDKLKSSGNFIVDFVLKSEATKIASGSYIGDDTTNRIINVGFTPKIVIIASTLYNKPSSYSYARFSIGVANGYGFTSVRGSSTSSSPVTSPNAYDAPIPLTDGFRVSGTYSGLNGSQQTYRWVAIG